MRIILIYFAYKYSGHWDNIYNALETKEKVLLSEINNLKIKIKNSKYKITTIIDKDYPKHLKLCYKPPFVVWTKGNFNLLNNKFIALIGNKSYNDKLKIEIKKNIDYLNSEYSFLISSQIKTKMEGLNLIIKEYLEVVAHGLDLLKDNNSLQLTISEFPPQAIKNAKREEDSYRIIAAIASKMIFISNTKESKILKLTKEFMNNQKNVYFLKLDLKEKSHFVNFLITNGVKPIKSLSKI